MNHSAWVTAALLAVAGVLPLSAAAQAPRFEGRAGAGTLQFRSSAPAGETRFSGVGGGMSGSLGLGRVALEISYAQGRLSADSGTAPDRDVADAGARLLFSVVPWLAVGAGGQLRGYITDAGTERWQLWHGLVRLEGDLVGGTVRARLQAWRSFAADVNVPPGAVGATGGSAGLVVRLPRSPVWGALAYTVDRANFASGGGSETLESVVVSVGIGSRVH